MLSSSIIPRSGSSLRRHMVRAVQAAAGGHRKPRCLAAQEDGVIVRVLAFDTHGPVTGKPGRLAAANFPYVWQQWDALYAFNQR